MFEPRGRRSTSDLIGLKFKVRDTLAAIYTIEKSRALDDELLITWEANNGVPKGKTTYRDVTVRGLIKSGKWILE
jgi:hypothetical protein